MKKLLTKIYLVVFLLAGDYIMFAQTPGTGNGGSGTDSGGDGENNTEGEEVAINGRMIILAITAVAFAYYYFNKIKAQRAVSN